MPNYDAESRTFTGLIDWAADPFDGDYYWHYTIVFSADFKFIQSGQVKVLDKDKQVISTDEFGFELYSQLSYSLFISDLTTND